MPEHKHIEVTGTIEDVFAHRFTLRTRTGKLLADLTPKGLELVPIRSGDEVTIAGEMKPSELKAQRVTHNGKFFDIEHPAKPHHGPKHHGPKHHDHDPEPVMRELKAQGYDVLARPNPKPKHFEVLAQRDGHVMELHVELDGHIRKTKPAHRDDHKWSRDVA